MGFMFVLVLPALVVVVAGVYYVYNEVIRLMSKSLVRNKVVVITDAVSGVGIECAKLFHKGGARLILCGKSWDKLESLSDDLSSASDPSVEDVASAYLLNCAMYVPQTFTPKLVLLDFSDMDSMPDVVTEVMECYGCVDVLICNSSLKIKAPVQTLSLEMDRTIMDTNYFGPITLAKGVLQSMISRRTGHMLLVNSIQGKLAVPFRTSYAASKHAVQAFFDCLRAEVEEYGISVSTISHTFITAGPQDSLPSPKPKNALFASIAVFSRHGVYPAELAEEILRTISRKKKEVLMAHPLPMAALYIRSFFPGLFFAVVAAGVKDAAIAEQLQ